VARGGDNGPSRDTCEAALRKYMPELAPVHAKLVQLAGGSDRAARFLSTWCPPAYLGGCSLACAKQGDEIRLVRNYDLSPELNEGLLLRSEWCGRPVMGMVEFLWGLSDGINEAGLSIALAYGGRQETGVGFGITTILRYVLETCDTVEDALRVFNRVPSHMPYNIVVADAKGALASVELYPGGGAKVQPQLIATNHQSDGSSPDRAVFTRTFERAEHLEKTMQIEGDPKKLAQLFKHEPLRQDRYEEGFGTLFTAEYNPALRSLILHWQGSAWPQTLVDFEEGQKVVYYGDSRGKHDISTILSDGIDWHQIGLAYAKGQPPDWRSIATFWKRVA
jgi:predicted choloylglycine hydrolase